jgi:hypothetical protein
MKTLQCCLVLFLCALPVCADDFRGRVISESGEPLSSVNVLDMPNQEAFTGADGRFILQSVPRGALKIIDNERSVRFTLTGFRPVTKVLKLNSDSEVVLKKDGRPSWTPGQCTSTAGMLRGDVMAFAVPQNSEVSRTQDVDYSSAIIQSGKDAVRLAWGAYWSWGIPGPYFFTSISQLEERSLILADNVTVAEYKGTRTDGTHFRYIGMFGETVSYDGAAQGAADYFDQIMDSICWARIPSSTRPPR